VAARALDGLIKVAECLDPWMMLSALALLFRVTHTILEELDTGASQLTVSNA
jgi:hypothetical protein